MSNITEMSAQAPKPGIDPNTMSIIVTKGSLDWAYPPFILSTTAAAMGHEVVMDEPWSSAMGHGHAIELYGPDGATGLERSYAAAADPRSEGSAAAF